MLVKTAAKVAILSLTCIPVKYTLLSITQSIYAAKSRVFDIQRTTENLPPPVGYNSGTHPLSSLPDQGS